MTFLFIHYSARLLSVLDNFHIGDQARLEAEDRHFELYVLPGFNISRRVFEAWSSIRVRHMWKTKRPNLRLLKAGQHIGDMSKVTWGSIVVLSWCVNHGSHSTSISWRSVFWSFSANMINNEGKLLRRRTLSLCEGPNGVWWPLIISEIPFLWQC